MFSMHNYSGNYLPSTDMAGRILIPRFLIVYLKKGKFGPEKLPKGLMHILLHMKLLLTPDMHKDPQELYQE